MVGPDVELEGRDPCQVHRHLDLTFLDLKAILGQSLAHSLPYLVLQLTELALGSPPFCT